MNRTLSLLVSAALLMLPVAVIIGAFTWFYNRIVDKEERVYEAWSQVDYVTVSALPPPPPGPRLSHDLATSFGPAFGLDAGIGSGRLSVVPSFRLLRTAVSTGRYDDTPDSPSNEIGSIYPGGYPEWTLRPGVSVRLRF